MTHIECKNREEKEYARSNNKKFFRPNSYDFAHNMLLIVNGFVKSPKDPLSLDGRGLG
jgi:hypothetical protein